MSYKNAGIAGILLVWIMTTGFCCSSCKSADKESSYVAVSNNAIYRTALKFANEVTWVYDPGYYQISYPNGDVPSGGACTDVIIRVLRKNGMDLQQLIHEDMKKDFSAYPNKWGLSQPDRNIDHRRVPNIMTYFSRRNVDMPVTRNENDYKPGDIICWELSPGITHIGILLDGTRVFHNIGPTSKIDDNFLFRYRIIGHYRL